MQETIFMCPYTFKFRTRLLTGTTSGMASDCVQPLAWPVTVSNLWHGQWLCPTSGMASDCVQPLAWPVTVSDTSYKPGQVFKSVDEEGGNILFNDALNTFYLRLYGVGHMVKDHSDSKRGNPRLPHMLLFLISSKGSFVCIIPQTG